MPSRMQGFSRIGGVVTQVRDWFARPDSRLLKMGNELEDIIKWVRVLTCSNIQLLHRVLDEVHAVLGEGRERAA